MAVRAVIDLNADLGETDGDLAIMPVVTSANVACGGHAGDGSTVTSAVEAALAHGVAVGAHASYADRPGFGRRELGIPVAEVARSVVEQVIRLCEVASEVGASVTYVKLHGALYHRAGRDRECALAILEALESAGIGPTTVLAQPGAALLQAARERGWVGVEEGFCDRLYRPDGTLTDRGEPGSVIEAHDAAARQAVCLAVEGGAYAGDGTWVNLRPASLCVHGDTPGALEKARAVRTALAGAGVVVAPFAPPPRAGRGAT
jgi:UPF0271 protein